MTSRWRRTWEPPACRSRFHTPGHSRCRGWCWLSCSCCWQNSGNSVWKAVKSAVHSWLSRWPGWLLTVKLSAELWPCDVRQTRRDVTSSLGVRFYLNSRVTSLSVTSPQRFRARLSVETQINSLIIVSDKLLTSSPRQLANFQEKKDNFVSKKKKETNKLKFLPTSSVFARNAQLFSWGWSRCHWHEVELLLPLPHLKSPALV